MAFAGNYRYFPQGEIFVTFKLNNKFSKLDNIRTMIYTGFCVILVFSSARESWELGSIPPKLLRLTREILSTFSRTYYRIIAITAIASYILKIGTSNHLKYQNQYAMFTQEPRPEFRSTVFHPTRSELIDVDTKIPQFDSA